MWDLFYLSDTDECQSNPCRNDADCVDLVNDYKCICKPGYEGKDCDHGKNKYLSISSYVFIKMICITDSIM